MKKVAILGIENSHAWSFASTLLPKEGEKGYEDIELLGFYADLTSADGCYGAEELKKVCACENFALHPDSFVENADAVMVTSRHGKYHLPFAEPYLKRGIPVWIDKPLCTNPKDAVELVELAKRHNAPVTGGSCLMFSKEIIELASYVSEHRNEITGGHITAPINMVNDYGDFWFYSNHLVQMLISIFGRDVRNVTAVRKGDHVEAVYEYDDINVTAYFGTGYTATIYHGGLNAKSTNISLDGCFDAELNDFYNMVKTGKGVSCYKSFIAPVFIIDATIRSFETGKTVQVEIPEV